jgi:EAL domain-containing protein (putative c-di-GMP-specific phosphodiesterase class I)
VTQEDDDAGIVEAILAMSGHLKLDVVAEGIETVEQLNFLQQRDCQRGQGYYFSRPLDFQAFETFVDSHAEKVLTAMT